MLPVFEAAKIALEGAVRRGADGAWRLAAVEIELAMVCRPCKAGETRHSTCERALRLARKFRSRSAGVSGEDSAVAEEET